MYDLARLNVSGFRGFVGNKEFVFDQPITILYGDNHRGKSSTLNAIEWCLFGNDCVGAKTGIRERVAWEICNRHMPTAAVAVTAEFEGDDGVYTVERKQDGAGRGASQSLTVVLPDQSKASGHEAEQILYSLFRSSFQDFMASVYQHQEAIRAVLTQEPRDRNDAIDRLLGLSQYRELVGGIARARLGESQKHMEGKSEQFRGKCEQSIHTMDNLIQEERANAVADGIVEDEICIEEALKRASSIAQAVQSLAKELGAVDFRIDVPEGFDQITQFREWVKEQTDELWAKSPDVLRQADLAQEQQRLSTLKGTYEESRNIYAGAKKEKEQFVDDNGDEATLDRATRQHESSLATVEGEIAQANTRASLVREAIQYLKAVDSDLSKGLCPLCGFDAPDLLSHLESEWEHQIKASVEQLESRRQEHRLAIERIGSLREQLRRIQVSLEAAEGKCASLVEKIADGLGRELKSKEDPAVVLGKRIEEIAQEQERLQITITNKREKISGIYDLLAKLRTIHEILLHEQKKAAIERIWETEEFNNLENLRDRASVLVEDVESIRKAIAAASREEAEAKIETAASALDSYFSCLAKHPAIPGLTMEVTEDRRSGLNSYTFMCHDGSDPAPILSQGDLNCLALSLFFGLAEATGDSRRFIFLMLDDPTQSLGPEMKRELANVLGQMAEKHKLLVATPDPEFESLLMTSIALSKATYDFADWNVANGPQVTRRT